MQSTGHYRSIGFSTTAASLAIFGLVVAMSLFAVRRVTGAFESALPTPALMATAAFVVVAIWSVRIVRPQARTTALMSSRAVFEARFVAWGPVTAVVLALVAFSWPMGRAIDWFIWLPILAGEAVFLWGGRPRTAVRSLRGSLAGIASVGPIEEPTEPILQQLTRIRNTTTGDEALFGTLCAEFAAGERVAVLHVAFCPPLARTPEVHAEQAEGPSATVRTTQILPHGARLEVRLSRESDKPSSVNVDFAAH